MGRAEAEVEVDDSQSQDALNPYHIEMWCGRTTVLSLGVNNATRLRLPATQ